MAKHIANFARFDSILITFTKGAARRVIHLHNALFMVVLKIVIDKYLGIGGYG